MSDLTTSAKLVAAAGMLPDDWRDVTGCLFDSTEEIDCLDEYTMDVSRPQTAFGLAMKLDEWEEVADPRWGRKSPWAQRVAAVGREHRENVLRPMITRLEYIGRDHAIRRALGWEVERGTLAKFWYHRGLGVWMMQHESIPKPEGWNGWGEWDCAWSFPGVATPGLIAETAVPDIHEGPPGARTLRLPEDAFNAVYEAVCS